MPATVDLILPTYRWNSYVRGYISYLVSVIQNTNVDLRLHIGDNSCNPEKHAFLSGLESHNVIPHLHPTNLGVHGNFTHLFNHSSGEYILGLSDDDWIHPDTFSQAEFLDASPECSACVGFFAAVPPLSTSGITCFDDRFMDPDPIRRAVDYIRCSLWEQGVNWLAFGMHRRKVMALYIEYTRRHPFQFWFRDQMLSQIELLTGPVKGLPKAFIYYRTRTPEEMSAQLKIAAESLEDIGLPSWIHHYYYFYSLACEYATLYLWRGMPDSLFSDRVRDADLVFNELFGRFRASYEQYTEQFENHFEEAKIGQPMYDVLDHPSAITGLRGLSALFSTTSPDAGARYAEFLRNEMVVDVFASSNG
jgi:glycosyltransferase involved in cell wall biosynthesis